MFSPDQSVFLLLPLDQHSSPDHFNQVESSSTCKSLKQQFPHLSAPVISRPVLSKGSVVSSPVVAAAPVALPAVSVAATPALISRPPAVAASPGPVQAAVVSKPAVAPAFVAHATHNAAPVVHHSSHNAAPAHHAVHNSVAPAVEHHGSHGDVGVGITHHSDHGSSYDEKPDPFHFTYGVHDDKFYTDFSESRTGDEYGNIVGEYQVALPDGRVQYVKYTADANYGGTVMEVSYKGEARHPEIIHHNEHGLVSEQV